MDFNASAIKNTVQKIKVRPNKKVTFFKLSEKDKPEPLRFFCSQKLFQCIKKKDGNEIHVARKIYPTPKDWDLPKLIRAFGSIFKVKKKYSALGLCTQCVFSICLRGGGVAMIPFCQNSFLVAFFWKLGTESERIYLFDRPIYVYNISLPRALFWSMERRHLASIAETFRKIKVKKLSNLGRKPLNGGGVTASM